VSAAKRNGPRLHVVATCQGCVYEHSEYYCIEDGNDVDSGHNVYCMNERAPGQRASGGFARVGDTLWTTPTWCPLLADARTAFAAELAAEVRP
jgi:hypothetical protein